MNRLPVRTPITPIKTTHHRRKKYLKRTNNADQLEKALKILRIQVRFFQQEVYRLNAKLVAVDKQWRERMHTIRSQLMYTPDGMYQTYQRPKR